jgi:hypothetical protein
MKDIVRDEPAYAPPPAVTGVLAGLAAGITAAHDEDHSVFHLLDTGCDGLWWCLALMDTAYLPTSTKAPRR